MIDYGKGYACTWALKRVDPGTWAATEEIPGLLSASFDRDASADLVESGSVRVASYVSEDEFYGRLEMLAEQDGEVERHPVITLLLSPGPYKRAAGGIEVEYLGRSVLAPAEDRAMIAGSYVPNGSDAAAYAASLIASCTPAPVSVEGSFTLNQNFVFARGTTHLEAAQALLSAAGWRVRISGDGSILIAPKPTAPALVLDAANASLLAPEVDGDGKLEDRHNRYIAVDGERRAVAVNDDHANPASFSRRGRYVDIYDDSPQPCNGESLEAYAARKLSEDADARDAKKYRREWAPDVTVGDLAVGSIGSVGLDGMLRIKNQSGTVGMGITIDETAEVLA